MEFLKGVLGEKYGEFLQIIKDYNNNNPDKPIKLADLSQGGYVDKDKYASLKDKYEKDTKRLGDEISSVQFDYALNFAIKEAKPRNIKALKALLDMDSLSYENGVIKGLKEQLAEIRKTDGYLFEDSVVQPKFTRPVSGADEELTRDDFKKLSYMEKLKLKREAPQIYSKMK